MKEGISRKVIHGTNTTLAWLHLEAGKSVPKHRHESEQITHIIRGKLSLEIDGKETVAGEGSILIIPPNVEHGVRSLEDSIVVDTFSTPRYDWLAGEDKYLR